MRDVTRSLLDHAHARVEQTRHGLRCAECRAPLPPEEVLGDA